LHMAQLMPLPLTVSCFSKIQIGFTFLVPAHPGSPGKRAIKRLCVCWCCRDVCSSFAADWCVLHILNATTTATTAPFNGFFSRTTWVNRYQKGKTSLDLNEARDDGVWGCSGMCWTICKSAPCSWQIPRQHPTIHFATGWIPFLLPNQP